MKSNFYTSILNLKNKQIYVNVFQQILNSNANKKIEIFIDFVNVLNIEINLTRMQKLIIFNMN